jgi:recombinational DNA repair protein RecT
VFNADRIDANDPLKNLKGGYCLAKLSSGEYMVDVMTAGEILAVRDSSKAKDGPWRGAWAGEMAKKTLIKRASKSWPQSNGRNRLDDAIQVLNEHEGIETITPTDEKTIVEFMELVAAGQPIPLLAFTAKLSDEDQAACFNAAPKGEKTKLKERVRQMIAEANNTIADYCTQITDYCEAQDPAAIELYEELDQTERELVNARLTDIVHRQLEALMREAA